jgi:hypothetical protein
MTKKFLILLAGLPFGEVSSAVFGPICQWHRDPCTSMAIHWVQNNGESPEVWRVAAGPYHFGENPALFLRRPIQLPVGLTGESLIVVEWPGGYSFNAYMNGEEIGQVPDDGQSVEFRIGQKFAGSRVLLGLSIRKADRSAGDPKHGPTVFVRDGNRRMALCDGNSSWNYLPGSSKDVRWNEVPPLAELVEPEQGFAFAYRLREAAEWGSADITSRPFGETRYRAFSVDLDNLAPRSRYVFKLLWKGHLLGTWFFETAPREFEDGISFVTGGDMFHTRELLDAMNRRAGTESPLFALLGGDLAYANGVDGDRWLEWIESWNQCAIAPDGRLIPMIPVIGNHEVKGAAFRPTNAPPRIQAPHFYSLFHGMTDGSKFAVDFGSYMTVIALDSGHTENVATQTQWLRETLESRAGFSRKFVCYHRPAWGTGAKPDAVEIQRSWCPLFEQHRVNAVFENDHHVYKRTHPLTAGMRDDAGGVVYMGDGAWGTRTRGVARNVTKTRPFLAHAEAANHLIKVTLRDNHVLYEAMTADGKLIDSSRRSVGK